MTREEAIEFGNMWLEINDDSKNSHTYEFIKMATQALEQDNILGQIRSEIESQRKEVSKKHFEDVELTNYYFGLNDGLKEARDIIDVYMTESEIEE